MTTGYTLILLDGLVSLMQIALDNRFPLAQSVEKIRTLAPHVLLVSLVAASIDTELGALQVLPFSGGEPYIMDIPAGLFAVFTVHLMHQYYKKRLRPLVQSVGRQIFPSEENIEQASGAE